MRAFVCARRQSFCFALAPHTHEPTRPVHEEMPSTKSSSRAEAPGLHPDEQPDQSKLLPVPDKALEDTAAERVSTYEPLTAAQWCGHRAIQP